MAREQLKNLTEPMYYILLSLLQDNHGYGIMQMVDELTEGRVVIGAGTLYSLLGRFEKEKIICQVAEENRRKIYHITEKGEALLQEEYERLNHLVEDGKKFFQFDGERKEPPGSGGDGHETEAEITAKALELAAEAAGTAGAGEGSGRAGEAGGSSADERGRKEKKEKRERKGILTPGGWSYGGAY